MTVTVTTDGAVCTAVSTADHAAAVRALLAKQTPTFTGR